jgi:hypothetical protein
MWIAKPLRALNSAERAAWSGIPGLPLAQSLAWADAADALRPGQVFMVFSPDEQVGGVVLSLARDGEYECVNGPCLQWEDPARAPRQLATFASAAAKIVPGFSSLALRPRWIEGARARIEPHLPVEARGWVRATTLVLDSQSPQFNARLCRTLRRADQAGIHVEVEPLIDAAGFQLRMAAFAARRGFHVPPRAWFETLARSADLTLVRATHAQAEAELLLIRSGADTHYLFGRQERRSSAPAWLSAAAVAHRAALEYAGRKGGGSYDLNGFASNLGPKDPYAGVAAFKAQFGGSIIHYEVPEFLIA